MTLNKKLYNLYIQSYSWNTRKKDYIRSLNSNLCELCKINKWEDVHHQNYDSLDYNNPGSELDKHLIYVCKECHDHIHILATWEHSTRQEDMDEWLGLLEERNIERRTNFEILQKQEAEEFKIKQENERKKRQEDQLRSEEYRKKREIEENERKEERNKKERNDLRRGIILYTVLFIGYYIFYNTIYIEIDIDGLNFKGLPFLFNIFLSFIIFGMGLWLIFSFWYEIFHKN